MLMLLDTPGMYFRAFYGIPESITAPDGTPINAVRGLLDVIARLVTERRPDRLVAAMDADWRPQWRVDAIPQYKLHRVQEDGGDQVPPGLDPQIPIIEEVLAAIGFRQVGVADFEADDVIGTLATSATEPVEIVTGDRDLFQLVRDDLPVSVIYTAGGGSLSDLIDEAAVARKYNIPGRSYAEFATLRGDPSDGLPGVRGVGEKTAAALIRDFGTVDAVVAAASSGDAGIPKGARAKILDALDYLDRAKAVVQVRQDVPIPAGADRLPETPADPTALIALAERWGIESPLARVVTALTQVAAAQASPE
jgi:5'-3' exonuclease